MADDALVDETPVTFNIKSSSDAKYVITIPLTMTVLDLKTRLSGTDYADIPPDRQRLIYSGRVLKDPDTLSSYKIKEGHTVHLVKGAASNQRQNPANSSTSTAGTGTTPAASGVPTNIAAGTGNNPLAGLTGARYAGFAQLPGADMFGPDGGMGPPPDPERMADMLQNPQYASALNEALQNPAIIEQMIRDNPMLRNMGPQVRQAMQDPNLRRMMTDPDMLRQAAQMQRQFGGMFPGMGGAGGGGAGGGGAFPAPGVTDTTPGQDGERGTTTTPGQANTGAPQQPPNPFAMFGMPGAAGAAPGAGPGAANPFAALFQPPPGTSPTTSPPPAGQEGNPASTNPAQPAAAPNNPFASMTQNMFQNPAMMQQMLAAMGGTGAGAGVPGSEGAAAAGFNPFAAMLGGGGMGGMGGGQAPPPADTRPPEERYEEQLRQLNDMGFYEFERNVEALRRTGGSVQGAVEYLLTQ